MEMFDSDTPCPPTIRPGPPKTKSGLPAAGIYLALPHAFHSAMIALFVPTLPVASLAVVTAPSTSFTVVTALDASEKSVTLPVANFVAVTTPAANLSVVIEFVASVAITERFVNPAPSP